MCYLCLVMCSVFPGLAAAAAAAAITIRGRPKEIIRARSDANYQSMAAFAARLAQSVERETLNLKVVGSTPTSGSIPDVPSRTTSPFLYFGKRLYLFGLFLLFKFATCEVAFQFPCVTSVSVFRLFYV